MPTPPLTWTLEHVPPGGTIGTGTIKTLTDWGFENPVLKYTSQGKTTFMVDYPQADITGTAIPASSPIPFEEYVVLRRNGLVAGYTGEIVFQGRHMPPKGNSQPTQAQFQLAFGDVWYDLENLVFQQFWNFWPNGLPKGPGDQPTKEFFSRVNLFQAYSQPLPITAAVNDVNGVSVDVALAGQTTFNIGDSVSAPLLPGLAAQSFPVVSTFTDGSGNTHVSFGNAQFPAQMNAPYVGPPTQPQATLWDNGTLQTNGQQLQEIINYAAGATLANGDIVRIQAAGDITTQLNWQLPIYPVRAASCASCIEICLKPTPDAVHWIDYTTTPPTFNCRQRQNLTPLTLPYADGIKHISTDITPRYDLVPSVVVLQYERIDNINNQPLYLFDTDGWPLDGHDNPPSGQEVRAMVVAIDLRGAQGSFVSSVVTAQAIPLKTGTTVPDESWWKLKRPAMANSDIAGFTIIPSSLVVKDDFGNTYPNWYLQFGNELMKGEIDPWMSRNVVNVTMKADFTYSQNNSDGIQIANITPAKPHNLSVRVKLTNSPSGTVTYQTVSSFASGESKPLGLAQNLYNALNPLGTKGPTALAYEGSHRVIDPSFDTTGIIPTPQYALNLSVAGSSGGGPWIGMLATIQEVSLDIMHQTAMINFGPPKHIAPGDLEELLQFYKFRTVYDNPALRISGQSSPGKPQLGGDNAKENTEHSNPNETLKTFTAPLPGPAPLGAGAPKWNFIQHDASNAWIVLKTVDSAGNTPSSTANIRIALGDAVGSDGDNKQLFIQEWDVCIANADGTNTLQKAMFLSTTPYPPPGKLAKDLVSGQVVGSVNLGFGPGSQTGTVTGLALTFTPKIVFLSVCQGASGTEVLFGTYSNLTTDGFTYTLNGAPEVTGYTLNYMIFP